MTASTFPSRTLMTAAERRLAAPSVAPVYAYASSYQRSLRPSDARFSRPESANRAGGDR